VADNAVDEVTPLLRLMVELAAGATSGVPQTVSPPRYAPVPTPISVPTP
jgi:hypothetical protein